MWEFTEIEEWREFVHVYDSGDTNAKATDHRINRERASETDIL